MLRLPEIIWFMLERAGLNVTTNRHSVKFLSCGCFEGVSEWNKAYFIYFLPDETAFISSVNEMCGEYVETSVKEIICPENSS